ncbi:protein transporter SEC24 [Gymnopilus junonius]|uniref:Protein transporter SEC24 n=1 Tax=Gymnopilus junonius TaxID=109634 RepID=A0A9P5TQF3_GYMJU|nr:protein transporter SEC24 [Gymnopilus junonius]
MYPHSNHIPQPPHSAGLDYKGLRPRIDPGQVPSPIDTIEKDRQTWESKVYMTLPGTHAPLCTSDFIAVDQGNSSPKFIRVSTWNMPSTSRLVSDSSVPIAAILHPFADLNPLEETVPLIDTGTKGPARCAQCRAYINPWCTWVSGGVRWKCNLCSHETEVLTEYFCNLDSNMLRLDHLERPEFSKGTIDFDVSSSEEYWAQNPPPHITSPYYSVEGPPSGPRKPAPMNYIFAFDVSNEALTSGFIKSSCDALQNVLYGNTNFPPSSRIAIVTFDSVLHFYDLTSDMTQMLVVADLDEVFLPTRTIFADPFDKRPAIEALLDSIPTQFTEAPSTDSCLGSAIRGGLAALAGSGGHIVIFQASLPSVGAGALPLLPPLESSLYDTDKEKTLHAPRSDTWISIAEECAEEGVGVSMFLAPSKYMDTGSVCIVSTRTGGEVFWHPRFASERDGYMVQDQLRRLVTRMQGFNCMVKVRCSHGLQVKTHFGAFTQSTPTELNFPHLSADGAFSVGLEVTRTMSTRAYAFIQCAVLYTTVDGRRRVRVINLATNVVELAGSLFQFADMDTVMCHLAKEAMAGMSQHRTLLIREELTEKCAAIHLGYRTQCAAATRSTQLIIPEAFRALAAFTLALQKTKPLKARQVSSDVRNYHIHRILSMSPRTLMHYLYPRLLALHDLDDTIALPQLVTNDDGTTTEKILMPSSMRDSYYFMEAHGVYLIDNEESMIFWIGASASPQLLSDLFGVDDVNSIDPHMHALPVLSSTLSQQVHNILAHRYAERGRLTRMYIARQNLDAAEIEFSDMLVEDQNNGAMSYFNYLALIHKQISAVLNNGGSLGGSSSIRGPPW